jgi:putative DNA primase/helicase
LRGADDDELEEIRAGLTASVEGLCETLLGKPTGKTGGDWRFNSRGSLSVMVRGAKKGSWFDHEAGIGGDMLALVRRERGGDFPATLEWARSFLGLGDAPGPMPHKRQVRPEIEAARVKRDAEAEADKEKRRSFAVRLWQESQIVATTPAEIYLVETRKIPRPARGWPAAAVRYHPGRCALVVGATNAAGEVRAVQIIHLTPGGKKRTDEDRPVKQSFGPQDGAVVRLPGTGDALLVAEGPETGLTAWAASGHETWIALGSMSKVEPPALRRLLVMADDDPRDAPAAKLLRKAVGKWRGEAREVAVVTPWSRRRFDKTDLNDLAQREGIEAVRAKIAAALKPEDPHPPGARLPVPLARRQLGAAVAGFFSKARAFDPDAEDAPPPVVHGIKGGVGLGKSDLARQGAAELLTHLRASGDQRTGAILVPTHKLGKEHVLAFEALPMAQAAGLTAAVWRGREADDPDSPGHKMCLDLPAIRDAQAVGARPDTAVCHDRDTNLWCPFHPDNPDRPSDVRPCSYQLQKRQKADLWIGAHELLFGEKPAAFGKLAFVVVDESAWRKGLEGVDGAPQDLTLDAIDRDVTIPKDDLAGTNTTVLRHYHGALADAVARLPLGPLHRDVMAPIMSRESAGSCRALSWDRVAKVDIFPGMTPAQRREAIAQAPNNRTAIRLARIFGALEALLADDGPKASGWVGLAQEDTPDGPVRMLRLRGRRKVAKGWQAPTLILDALLNPELVRPFWPQIEMAAEIEARTPYMRVRQQVGRDWAKNALVPDDYNPTDRDRRLKNSEKLRAAVWREACARGGRSLVVAQKSVEEYWLTCGPIPQGLELAHHNNVAGRDEWGPGPGRDGVRSLVVVGRTLPRPRDVERIAEALTGAAVTARASRYDRVDTAIVLADGTAATTEADRHPDPLAEAIRWEICEGEIVQIIGRGRGVNRTAKNPLEVLILTDRPLPLPVDEAVSWESLAPSPTDLMLAQAGVALESPSDAALCFANLWPTSAAAKMAASRGKWVTSPYRYLLIGECYPLRQAVYRKAGQGKRDASLHFDPSAVPLDELRGWLEDRLGELAMLEVQQPEPEPDPPAPPPADPDGLLAIQNRAAEVDPDGWLTGPSAGARPSESPVAIGPKPGRPPPEPSAPSWRGQPET